MKQKIDIDALLAPIPGGNPSGDDVRYSQIFEDIKEARKSEDPLEVGESKNEIKTADWEKVVKLSVEALTNKSKDLQIAAWLTEGLLATEGFEGLATGLKIATGLLQDFWDTLYPPVEDGDLEFRAAPLDFMNEKLWSAIKQLPVTDEGKTPGYSWFKYQESREVGYESDTRNKYGDVDENKKNKRDEDIEDGKITAEQFDAAVAASSGAFYKSLAELSLSCFDEFKVLDATVDEKFKQEAPRLAELGKAIEECNQLVARICKEKNPAGVEKSASAKKEKQAAPTAQKKSADDQGVMTSEEVPLPMRVPIVSGENSDGAVWDDAVQVMETSGVKEALDRLLTASFSTASVRDKNRYRLMMAKLCLRAERADLARPIAEELYALMEELHLDRWESPVWIAEVLNVLYQCLMSGEPSDDDLGRARTLFQRLCTTDVTKALTYRQ
ncbi:MAG TPA: type VI secretion system protein TssA [Syntrophorhabdales bacterium]|nr:type VI secretion system protein TssA [Syntrophorhabdales bacterium]